MPRNIVSDPNNTHRSFRLVRWLCSAKPAASIQTSVALVNCDLCSGRPQHFRQGQRAQAPVRHREHHSGSGFAEFVSFMCFSAPQDGQAQTRGLGTARNRMLRIYAHRSRVSDPLGLWPARSCLSLLGDPTLACRSNLQIVGPGEPYSRPDIGRSWSRTATADLSLDAWRSGMLVPRLSECTSSFARR